jgi:hypothetical protein
MLAALASCAAPLGSDVEVDEIDAVEFQDPDSDFSTTDVRDVDDEIVRFDATALRLIWVADDLAFDGWDVNGNQLAGGFYTVRFGTEDGERRAYFTETSPPTICDISVSGGALSISSTNVTVPQE